MKDTTPRCWVCYKPITWGQSTAACGTGCRSKLYKESYRLIRHREEAYQRNLSYDLTLEEWAATLRYFHWQCAYCGGPFESIDHFIPVSMGGGITVANVVPACILCNGKRKGGYAPQNVIEISRETIEKITRYLIKRGRRSKK